MKKFAITFLLCVLCLSACVSKEAKLSVADKSEIEDAVDEAFKGLIEAAKSLDVDRYIKFFSKEKFTSLNEDGTVFHSLDEFEDAYKKAIAGVKSYESLEFNKVKITVVDKSTAILVNEFEAKVILKSGETVSALGAGTQVWSKIEDSWKLVSVSSSSRSPSEKE